MYNALNRKQIRPGAISNEHLSDTAAIDESKLSIDWESRRHKPFAEDKKIDADDPLIGTSEYLLEDADGFVIGNKSLQVYLNGGLQMVDEHYTEIADDDDETKGIGISFIPESLVEGDIIQLRWYK